MYTMPAFGDHSFNPSKVIVRKRCFFYDLVNFDPKCPWRSRSNSTIYTPIWDLPKMYLMAKFSDPSFNLSKVIVRTSLFFAKFDPNDLEGQNQIPPYTLPSKIYPWYTKCSNMVTLASILRDILCGQACFSLILTPNYLEGQGQIPEYTILYKIYMMHLMPKLGDPSWNPSKVIAKTSLFFCRFWPQMTYNVQVKFRQFKPIWELPKMHLLAKFGNHRVNLPIVIAPTNLIFFLICAVLALFLVLNDLEDQG